MNKRTIALHQAVLERFPDRQLTVANDELTLLLSANELTEVLTSLRDEPALRFEQLVDLCVVDYLHYGQSEWNTNAATATGFSRAVDEAESGRMRFGEEVPAAKLDHPRYAVVYHLLSYNKNHRLRVKSFAEDDSAPIMPSVCNIWASADWNEREAFDLFGVLFEGHPDLRRILTDYGFIGHPFRKDFPLIGNVEMRYDPEHQRVVYEPVSIDPRVTVAKVIRNDYPVPGAKPGRQNDA
jgi:NADH-quinone oxidoreductase subunit C